MLITNIGSKRESTSNLLKALLFFIVFSALFIAFVPVKAQTVKSEAKVLKDTTVAGRSYKMYLGLRGGKYIIRTSAKGNTYKQYFKAK